PAQSRVAPEPRRLKGQELTALGQRGLDLRERCPTPGRDHELRRLIVDDAPITGNIQQLAVDRFAVEILRSRAAQLQRCPRCFCSEHALTQHDEIWIHRIQKRGSSGWGSAPPRTCIFPYSAHRASVGMALPGLSSPAGSKAFLTAKKAARSWGENCTHIEL